jgi:MFS family permease
MSIVLAQIVVPVTGKGPVLIWGAICFALVVAIPFFMIPDLSKWTPVTLIIIYALYGMGRATFESTLKAVFADFFYYEKEGAFANIILQNGLASAIGYVLTFSLLCQRNENMNAGNDNYYQQQQQQHHSLLSRLTSGWCVEYHNVGVFELLVLGTCLLAIMGYLRASFLHHHQHDRHYELMHQDEDLLLQEEEDDTTHDPTLETTTTTTTSSISSSTLPRK